MTLSPDDTQPRLRPVKDEPVLTPTINPDDETAGGGPGCMTWALVGGFALFFALAIVALAGTAGWTAGQREGLATQESRRSADIATQCASFVNDVRTPNPVILEARYDYLASITPGVTCLQVIPATATALYLTSQPTITPTATTTPTATATAESTEEPEALPTSEEGGYDLTALLNEAQNYMTLSDYPNAIETLDVIIALDPDFESATVREMMLRALNAQALLLFRSGDTSNLAEAILLADRAEEFGSLADGVAYEREVAIRYLDAVRTVGTSYPAAIQALNRLYDFAPDYMNVRQLLFEQYVAYANAWIAQGEYCPAYVQFDAALNVQYDVSIVGLRDNANNICLTATPTGGVVITPIPGTELTPTILPVGQQP